MKVISFDEFMHYVGVSEYDNERLYRLLIADEKLPASNEEVKRMNPLNATAYAKGIRAARDHKLRPGSRPPTVPYSRPALVSAWRRGWEDYQQFPNESEYFIKQTACPLP